MKILGQEEKEAHIAHITHEGAKGLLYGSILSAGLYAFLKIRHPVKFRTFNTSIKTCIIIMPTIAVSAFYADQGSVEFDRRMHSGTHQDNKVMEEYKEWQKMSTSDKIVTSLNNNKYPIIIASWAASLYGSWVFVNRDKIMTTTQKAVQARMYAQFITIILLLGTIYLSVKEQELEKSRPPPIPEWRRVLMEREADETEKKKIIDQLKAAKKEVDELKQ